MTIEEAQSYGIDVAATGTLYDEQPRPAHRSALLHRILPATFVLREPQVGPRRSLEQLRTGQLLSVTNNGETVNSLEVST